MTEDANQIRILGNYNFIDGKRDRRKKTFKY